MVSFNIRKLNRTVNEKMSASDDVPAEWYDMFMRYVNLAERLKSSESKIYSCLDIFGKGSDESICHALMFSENSRNRSYVKKHVKKPVFRTKAPAFPVMKDVIREEISKETDCKQPSDPKDSMYAEESAARELTEEEKAELLKMRIEMREFACEHLQPDRYSEILKQPLEEIRKEYRKFLIEKANTPPCSTQELMARVYANRQKRGYNL